MELDFLVSLKCAYLAAGEHYNSMYQLPIHRPSPAFPHRVARVARPPYGNGTHSWRVSL
jgi:hypothetical protein